MYRWIIFLFAITFALTVQAGPITYQGQLQDSSGPVDTQVEIVFELYELDEGGSPIATDSHDDVVVTDGLFQVELNFGTGAFDGSERWLEVIVDGQALAPRQRITAAPMALHAAGAGGESPWTVDGDDIHFTGGRVGIGTSSPDHTLEVRGSTALGVGQNVASGFNSFVSGGNLIFPSTVISNTASGTGSFVGGGGDNLADGTWSFVAGGRHNAALGGSSFAGGWRARAEHDGTFVWSGTDELSEDDFASTGPDQFLVRARGGVRHMVGYGGLRIEPADVPNVIGGWEGNTVALHVRGATIGGGGCPEIDGTSLCEEEQPNQVVGNGHFGTVGGGRGNTVSTFGATVGGGAKNTASSSQATIGGGSENTANGPGSTVGGGNSNVASGGRATVGGGFINTASGTFATVPGGRNNEASGAWSFAAGSRAKAQHNGTFVWADSTTHDFASTDEDQFLILAGGGAGINTNDPNGFDLAVDGSAAKPGGGSWSTFSDARLKQNIQPVSEVAGSLLERLLELTAYSFEYTEDAVDTRLGLPGKQIGLLAQEVKEVFPQWVDTDEDGYLYVTERGTTAIMVEALRELSDRHDRQIAELRDENAELREIQDEQLAELRAENADLREQIAANSKLAERNADLEDRLAALEALLLEDRQVAKSQK